MNVTNEREMGLMLRERRRDLGLTQAELAEQIGASRYWVIEMEKGKSTAEVGLMLRALRVLGLVIDIRAVSGS
ncbi:MAG: helix-turn-helix domain-containing protein [Longimicrobiales bacterium]|nr:helix-turn-helix domain-containing protein [Longimicrobiales bacterium]